jgi:hypothetical protein
VVWRAVATTLPRNPRLAHAPPLAPLPTPLPPLPLPFAPGAAFGAAFGAALGAGAAFALATPLAAAFALATALMPRSSKTSRQDGGEDRGRRERGETHVNPTLYSFFSTPFGRKATQNICWELNLTRRPMALRFLLAFDRKATQNNEPNPLLLPTAFARKATQNICLTLNLTRC